MISTADIEQRVRSLALSIMDEGEPDSFAVRAESYYHKRPQLIVLLHDLHLRYLYLADRYSQSLLKTHRRRTSSALSNLDDFDDDVVDPDRTDSASSDADSSLSFQLAQPASLLREQSFFAAVFSDLDMIVAELVAAWVEMDILVAGALETEKHLTVSARKIELQGSLVDLLESERTVLLGQNARLEYRAATAEEEGRVVAAELGYMRQRASELARAVVKLREDHRVCFLGRRIGVLQTQIHTLERRNRECFAAMAKREKEKGEARAEVDRLREENCRLKEEAAVIRANSGWVWKWRVRFRWVDRGPCTCAPHVKKELKERKGCFLLLK